MPRISQTRRLKCYEEALAIYKTVRNVGRVHRLATWVVKPMGTWIVIDELSSLPTAKIEKPGDSPGSSLLDELRERRFSQSIEDAQDSRIRNIVLNSNIPESSELIIDDQGQSEREGERERARG